MEAPRYKKPQERPIALWRENERGASTRKASYVLAKVSQQDPYRRDGCAAHTSIVIHTSREKADVDSHTHMCYTYIQSGQREILLRVSSQNQNRKPLRGCLTLHAEAQKAETTPGNSDTHTRLYKTEPELKQNCSEERLVEQPQCRAGQGGEGTQEHRQTHTCAHKHTQTYVSVHRHTHTLLCVWPRRHSSVCARSHVSADLWP